MMNGVVFAEVKRLAKTSSVRQLTFSLKMVQHNEAWLQTQSIFIQVQPILASPSSLI